jgi:nucleoside-diphosphate-sugar epimerase
VIAQRGVVAVTGAGGFIGRHLVAELARRGYFVRALVRQQANEFRDHSAIEIREVRDIVGAPWGELLEGAEAVVHLAAIAHRAEPGSAPEAQRIRRVNVEAVADLTRAAAAVGVRRIVLLSSIGVLGATSDAIAFDDAATPAPHDFYSRTKLDAERAAGEASSGSRLEVCLAP